MKAFNTSLLRTQDRFVARLFFALNNSEGAFNTTLKRGKSLKINGEKYEMPTSSLTKTADCYYQFPHETIQGKLTVEADVTYTLLLEEVKKIMK